MNCCGERSGRREIHTGPSSVIVVAERRRVVSVAADVGSSGSAAFVRRAKPLAITPASRTRDDREHSRLRRATAIAPAKDDLGVAVVRRRRPG